jgi:hypothetical protein
MHYNNIYKNSNIVLAKHFHKISVTLKSNLNIIRNQVGEHYIIRSTNATQCNTIKK